MNEHTEVEQFIGIDVSKETLDMGVYPSHETLHVSYDDAGLKRMVERLQSLKPKGVVLEATGGLETRISAERIAQGFMVAVVNPRQARHMGRTGRCARCLIHGCTDRNAL